MEAQQRPDQPHPRAVEHGAGESRRCARRQELPSCRRRAIPGRRSARCLARLSARTSSPLPSSTGCGTSSSTARWSGRSRPPPAAGGAQAPRRRTTGRGGEMGGAGRRRCSVQVRAPERLREHDRASRLNALGIEAARRGRGSALLIASPSAWLEAIASADPERGGKLLLFAREFVEERHWLQAYQIGQPRMIPTAGGRLATPDRAMLTPPAGTPAGSRPSRPRSRPTRCSGPSSPARCAFANSMMSGGMACSANAKR